MCIHLVAYGYKNMFDKEDNRFSILSEKDIHVMVNRFDYYTNELIQIEFNYCPLCGEKHNLTYPKKRADREGEL